LRSTRASRSLSDPAGSDARSKRRTRRGDAGFTILEVLIVIGMITFLVMLVGPNVMRQFESSKSKTANIQIQNIRAALDIYVTDCGQYPNEGDGLQVLVSAPAGSSCWNGPYLKDGRIPVDPWGRPYRFQPTPDNPSRVISLGPSGSGGDGSNGVIGR
jgi:general secretion pathway protein G